METQPEWDISPHFVASAFGNFPVIGVYTK